MYGNDGCNEGDDGDDDDGSDGNDGDDSLKYTLSLREKKCDDYGKYHWDNDDSNTNGGDNCKYHESMFWLLAKYIFLTFNKSEIFLTHQVNLSAQVIEHLLSNKMTRIVVVFADRTQVGRPSI